MKRDEFVFGYGKSMNSMLLRRTVYSNARFLLPYLKPPGLRLLDCGCGPGSITMGLAEELASGQVIGIDVEEKELAMARKEASRRSLSNLKFEKMNVYELPFSDNSFDIVFSSGMMGSITNPGAALSEMGRVLKPQGLLALRDFDFDGILFYPQTPLVLKSYQLFFKIREHAGQIRAGAGAHLRKLVNEAGFETAEFAANCDVYADAESIKLIARESAKLVSESWAKELLELSLATQTEIDEMAEAWKLFGKDPNAFFSGLWCEALAWKKPEHIN